MISYKIFYKFLNRIILDQIDMLLGSMILKDCGKHVEEMEEEFQLMYFASEIIGGTFEFFKIERVKIMSWKITT